MSQPVRSSGGRAYKHHRGNVRFLLCGRLQTSDDNLIVLLITLAVVFASPPVWVAFEAPYIWRAVSPAPIIIFAYSTLNMWASLCRTAFCDPGIIPRNLDDDEPAAERFIDISRVDDGGVPGSLHASIPSQWCATCHTFRPPRTSHCRACNNCVDTIDHHCIFLNACIGRRNYAAFVSMLFHMVCTIVISIVCSALHIYYVADPHNSGQRRGDGTGFLHALRQEPQCVVFFWTSCIFFVPVACLLTYHTWLISQNRTTIEQIRLESTGRVYDMERRDTDCFELSAFIRGCSRFSARVRAFFVSSDVTGAPVDGNARRKRTPFQRAGALENARATLGRPVPPTYISWRDAPP